MTKMIRIGNELHTEQEWLRRLTEAEAQAARNEALEAVAVDARESHGHTRHGCHCWSSNQVRGYVCPLLRLEKSLKQLDALDAEATE